jgi:hypothetical protein
MGAEEKILRSWGCLLRLLNARIIVLCIAVIYGNYANAYTAVGQNCFFCLLCLIVSDALGSPKQWKPCILHLQFLEYNRH